MKILLISTLALALSACGGDYKEPVSSGSTAQFGAQQVNVISGSLTSGSSLAGTGSALFAKDFGSFKSGGSYALDFTLQEGGSLTLVSHSDSTLNSGWEITFRRQGTGPGSLKVAITAQGTTRDTNNSSGMDVFAGLDASGALKFQVDVHNDETPTHAVVWSRLLGDNFQAELALLNTEENDNSPGIGTGTRWGLRLDRAAVTRADESEPKFED
jgi:hypothetical protein